MAINKLSLMKEKEQIRQSIVKNNIFMLKKLGIDVESPNCIVDFFNNLVLFVEASEENKNASRLLENPSANNDYEEDEVRYSAKELENAVDCSGECCYKPEDPYMQIMMEDPVSENESESDLDDIDPFEIELNDGLNTECLAAKFAETLKDDMSHIVTKYKNFLKNPKFSGSCSKAEIDHIKNIVKKLENYSIGKSPEYVKDIKPYDKTLKTLAENGITNEFLEKYKDNLGYAIQLANMYGADTPKMISMWEQSKKETKKHGSKVEVLIDDLEDKE